MKELKKFDTREEAEKKAFEITESKYFTDIKVYRTERRDISGKFIAEQFIVANSKYALNEDMEMEGVINE